MTAPKVIATSTSREGRKEAEAPLQEPEPEPRKDESCSQFHSVNDMNGDFCPAENKQHFLEMGVGEGDEDPSVGVDEVDTETQVEATEVALPSEDFTMEDEEAEHLALADDLAKLEAEIALAEQLLNPEDPQDPEEPEPAAELLASVPMVSCQSFNLLKVVFSSMLWSTFLWFEMTEWWWTCTDGMRCIHKSCTLTSVSSRQLKLLA